MNTLRGVIAAVLLGFACMFLTLELFAIYYQRQNRRTAANRRQP